MLAPKSIFSFGAACPQYAKPLTFFVGHNFEGAAVADDPNFASKAVAYSASFQNALRQIALKTFGPAGAMKMFSLYTPMEITQGAWAGAKLDMPVEKAVVSFVIMQGALTQKTAKRSLVQKLTNSHPPEVNDHLDMIGNVDQRNFDAEASVKYLDMYEHYFKQAVARELQRGGR